MDRDTWHNSISMDLTRSFDSDGDYRCIYFIVDAAMVGFLPDVELDQFGTVESFNDLAAVSSDPWRPAPRPVQVVLLPDQQLHYRHSSIGFSNDSRNK